MELSGDNSFDLPAAVQLPELLLASLTLLPLGRCGALD